MVRFSGIRKHIEHDLGQRMKMYSGTMAGRTAKWALALLVSVARSQGPAPVYINAPYVTTPEAVVTAMLRLAGVKSSDTVYDLGCGDGRIVIAAAKEFGAHGVGIDNNPARIEEARRNARQAGVETLVRFEVADLFEADIHNATVVTLYLLPDVNLRLRPKLLHGLRAGARIVSHSFSMGDWHPEKDVVVESSHIYLWKIPALKNR
ncbi:MAG: SAM-dependent methyltransferase [Terriglobia bacterium]|nr:MAG: SAM-dependent methyltransferase [Terriglobia bacterium]